MAASSSTSANPNNNNYYHVFLNHRGPDVKKTFASYLYRRLISHGLRVFLDQQELQQGNNLTDQIVGAIRNASVHVAIFSPGYAESKWCLDELLLMLESGATIIPVFYHVKPAEVRWTRGKDGKYAQDIQKLEKKKTYDPETRKKKLRHDPATIEKWRSALSSVADISGFDLQEACNGDEGELLDRVVEQVLKKVKRRPLHVAKYPTGLGEKVEDFENGILMQEQQPGKPPVYGIVGLGGIGKTTLAKELFNRKSSQYSKSCFLSDVRENAQSSLMLEKLQSKLLKSLTGSDQSIDSVDEGIERLKECLSFCQALIILDDADHVNQVDALLPDLTVVPSDSLILITSRNKDVLMSSGVQESSIYKLTGLDIVPSLELFCSHAFNQDYPVPGFESLVLKFLIVCDGLPLSLKVFGALLHGKTNKSYWEDQLDKLQSILPNEIQKTLKISYDALDTEEKQIFLDIACFVAGRNRDTAIRIWDGSGWKGRLGLQNLQNRCLVEVFTNYIYMHDHLRDLGMHIWQTQLQQSSVITELRRLRGIHMVKMVLPDRVGDEYLGLQCRKLQLRNTDYDLLEDLMMSVCSPKIIWLRWEDCPCTSLPSWIPLQNLRVLQMQGSVLETLWEGESQTPFHLRELQIDAPLCNFPKSIGRLKHLEQIFLDCRGNENLKELPEEFCQLRSLKALVLKQFHGIKSLPECFGNLSNLQHIELYRFHDLERLPDSFGNLTNLQHINIPYCLNLKIIPNSFGNLTNLQHIDMSTCMDLERLPNSFGNLIKLKFLNLHGCSNLTISSESLGNIITLEYINLHNCGKIEVLPLQVAHQRSLEQLYMTGTGLKELPSATGNLRDLEALHLGSLSLCALPPSLGYLSNLKELVLSDCWELKCLPSSVGLLSDLIVLRINECALSELPFKRDGEKESRVDSSIDECMPLLHYLELWELPEISELSFDKSACPNLGHLRVKSCDALVEVGALPNALIKVELTGCGNLRQVEGLCGLAKLQELEISFCHGLEELLGFETLLSLEKLVVCSCRKLKRILGFNAQLTKLRTVDVSDCDVLEELEGVEYCRALQELNIRGCPKLHWGEGALEQLHQQLKEGLVL